MVLHQRITANRPEQCRSSRSALLGGGAGKGIQRRYNAPVLRFEWDETKNTENKRKHRVSFEEAQTVFSDERAVLIEDEDQADEERFLLLGLSATLRVL